MRVLPNMIVVCPGDAIEAEKATKVLARTDKPAYLRLTRAATPTFSTLDSPFEIGQAYVLRQGSDATIVSTGIMTAYALRAANELQSSSVSVEVVHVPLRLTVIPTSWRRFSACWPSSFEFTRSTRTR